MMNNPEVLRELLERLTDALIVYVCHQIDSGAQVGTPSCATLASVLWCFYDHQAMEVRHRPELAATPAPPGHDSLWVQMR